MEYPSTIVFDLLQEDIDRGEEDYATTSSRDLCKHCAISQALTRIGYAALTGLSAVTFGEPCDAIYRMDERTRAARLAYDSSNPHTAEGLVLTLIELAGQKVAQPEQIVAESV